MRPRTALSWITIWLIVAAAAGCAPRRAALATAPPTPSAPSAPTGALEPIEVAFAPGTLPRAAGFGQAVFTVVGGLVTNLHPYTMFGEPKPGQQLYGVLAVRGANIGDQRVDYVFNEDAFRLRTYAGAVIEPVHPIGTYDFSGLPAGAADLEDRLVFPLRTVSDFDGAALLIGRPPDAPAILELTAPPSADGSQSISAAAANIAVGPLTWTLIEGQLGLDRPPGVCCPETGPRANADERFVTLTLRAVVSGSQYGQASVTTDLVRLVAGDVELEPIRFHGQANVAEGDALELTPVFLIDAATMTLQLRLSSPNVAGRTIDLQVAP